MLICLFLKSCSKYVRLLWVYGVIHVTNMHQNTFHTLNRVWQCNTVKARSFFFSPVELMRCAPYSWNKEEAIVTMTSPIHGKATCETVSLRFCYELMFPIPYSHHEVQSQLQKRCDCSSGGESLFALLVGNQKVYPMSWGCSEKMNKGADTRLAL